MLRILKRLILTTLFAVFATQASAMFIQPDWFDPTQQGVGTNRYSYSFNDPINRLDPNGNEARESWDGPDPSEADKLDEELSYVSDVLNSTTLSTEEKIAHVRDLYDRVNSYNLKQQPSIDQAIGLGGLAEAMHNLQNAPGAAVGAQPPAQGVATVSVGPRATNTPRETVNGQSNALPPGIGVGPYASPTGGIPASRPNSRATAAEARAVTQQGKTLGCHNCGTKTPGTRSGRFVNDHQKPTSLNPTGAPQHYFPHCTSCSARQGGLLRWFSQ